MCFSELESEIKRSSEALILSTVSHAMVDALRTDPFPQLDWTHQIQPIEHLLDTIQDSGVTDEFVRVVTSTLPTKAINRGVYSMNALKKRFYEVEKMARKVSMIKEKDDNSLVMYLLSYLRSFLLIHPVTVVSLSEKTNRPLHLGRLHNEAILDRAKYVTY